MPQSLGAVYIHAVFSTKNRHPFFVDTAQRTRIHSYLAGTSNALGCQARQVGGVEDHVHVLARMARTITIADWIKELKRVSSLWLKQAESALPDFAWQAGYGAFSVGYEHVEPTATYIANQEEHHRNRSFADEYRLLLTRHGVEWDERYVWD